jgi:NAD-dependent dihydropyrimidine dehydrogenase PreA subunit
MALRNIIRIDEALCDGCGECVPSCAEGALQVIDGKARLVSDVLCDGLGACLGECPTGALTVIQREAVEFDEAAATAQHQTASVRAPTGCPSSSVRVLPLVETGRRPAVAVDPGRGGRPGLQQWPVQLHLVPPTAPFFHGRHVLLAADCVPVAVVNFHAAFLDGRGLAIACPKLDQHLDLYVQKLAAMIDEAGILSLTVAIMEVPCCTGLVRLAEQALAIAGRRVPLRLVKVGIRGDILAEHEA